MLQPSEHGYWTPERSERLMAFVAEGMSARVIAFQLGDVTRNAVIGRINRLKNGAPLTRAKPLRKPLRKQEQEFAVHPKVATARERLMACFAAKVFSPDEFGAARAALDRATRRYHPRYLRDPAQCI